MSSWNISEWSIKKPIPTIVLFIVLTLMGAVSFKLLGIDEDPNIEVPVVSITVTQPGAAPTELETQVTRRIEDSVASLGGIDAIRSRVTDGVSLTSVEFVIGTNVDRAVNEVRNAVTKVRQNLPQDILEPIVERVTFSGGPVLTYTVSSKTRSVEDLSWLVDNDIARALLSVRGVSQVSRSGGVSREIRVNLDPNRLKAVGITSDQVNQQLRNLNANLPGGRGEVDASEQTIRTLGSALSVEQLRGARITLPNGATARLDTLGTVEDGFSDVRQLAYLNGKSVVAFSIIRSTGSNLVAVDEGVNQELERLREVLPKDVEVTLIRNTRPEYTKEAYWASIEALFLGAALALVVIFLFLKDWRATLISTMAMPLSIIPTFIVMKALDYTLNSMTLLALALVVGVLVDDAIVEIENIARHIRMGKTPYQAALDASAEIGLAVVATTMTIVAVFFPVAFMTGIPGQFFRPFGITVSVSVLCSLLVARTITPLMAAYLLKVLPDEEEESKLIRGYEKLLRWSLKHPAVVLAGAAVFFVGTLFILPRIPTSFISQPDRGEVTFDLELPPGATLADTDRAVRQASDIIKKRPEVKQIFTSVGYGSVNKAALYVNLVPKDQRTISQSVFEQEIRIPLSEVPGVRLSVAGTSVTGADKPLSVTLIGDNPQSLDATAATLVEQMRTIPGLVDVNSSASLLNPELLIRPDLDRAAEQGVAVASIARTAKIATIGEIESNLAKFNLPDRQIPIRVQLDPRYRTDFQALGDIQVATGDNRTVPLRSVAQITMGSGSSQIDRFNRARKVTVGGNLDGLALGEAVKRTRALPILNNLPADVREQSEGETKVLADIFGQFILVLSAAVIFIYAVLVLLFSDFVNPLTIMVALPLSLGGALIGLLVFGKDLGIYAVIGILMLMGLVTKNSILLVEYSILAMRGEAIEKEGVGKPLPRFEAILKAGRARVQPILMTTIAMIAGMLPIALALGAGSEVRSPMAVAVVGGLITSTLLTLVVVPVVFNLVGGLMDRFKRRPTAPDASLTPGEALAMSQQQE
ncbi:efflux RND transporter permease subunit [Anthocerotibacter panamensis]|uniref:efflux RND transporter permease subunit n=1 Tax=Anthocerotibacter panamensis TaxID=2857077 RepID=UPI001C4064C2|nr:efflux RND transporter permease subunit [Anthocerotibacter panamensis]